MPVMAERPSWSLTRAAQECGVSRDTMKRRLADNAFPNAVKDDRGAWQIPVTDLLAAGMPPKMTKGTAPVQLDMPPEVAPEATSRVVELETTVKVLEAQLEGERALREAAERNSSDLRHAMRMLEAPTAQVVHPAPRRRWWQR